MVEVDWRNAQCLGDTELFDKANDSKGKYSAVVHLAKEVCKACVIRLDCLDDALSHASDDDPGGIRGGMMQEEREGIRRRIKRSRRR